MNYILRKKEYSMSRKYKFRNESGVYFVSFSIVYWVDIFVREIYFNAIVESLDYCRKNRGMILYGYCIMPSHIHLLFQSKDKKPMELIRDFKRVTAKDIISLIENNVQESRREWLLWVFRQAGKRSGNVSKYQFWQHHSQPIEIYSDKFFFQKLKYIHQNPVESGFVCEASDWKYSSAKNYNGLVNILEIDNDKIF